MDDSMLFGATLKKNSPIFRNWRAQSLLIGQLEGVPFRFTGVDYVVDQIPGGKVTVLLAHNNVIVHVIAPSVETPVVEDLSQNKIQKSDKVEDTEDLSEGSIQTSDTPAPKPRGRPPLSRK